MPAEAQTASAPRAVPSPPSYGTTWASAPTAALYHQGTWQVNKAASVVVPLRSAQAPSQAFPVEMPPIVPLAEARPAVFLITAAEQGKEQSADKLDRPTLYGTPEVFRLESERRLRERAQAEAREAGKQSLPFPKERPLSPGPPPSPRRDPVVARVEPTYVSYERLMFEQPNRERYGWDLGPVDALASAATFYGQVLTAPAARLVDPCRRSETSAGYCLPGDPVPLRVWVPVVAHAR